MKTKLNRKDSVLNAAFVTKELRATKRRLT